MMSIAMSYLQDKNIKIFRYISDQNHFEEVMAIFFILPWSEHFSLKNIWPTSKIKLELFQC